MDLFIELYMYASHPSTFLFFTIGTVLMVDEVKIGSLCIVDLKPRILTNEELLNFLDIGAAVGNLICERNQRKERIIKTCQDSVRMTVDMMADFKVNLLSVHNSARILLQNAEFGGKFEINDKSGTEIGTGNESPNLTNIENMNSQYKISTEISCCAHPIEYHDVSSRGENQNEGIPKLDKNEKRRRSRDLLEGGKREESSSYKEVQGKYSLNETNNLYDEKLILLEKSTSGLNIEEQRKKDFNRENTEKTNNFHALKNLECQISRLRLILESNMCLGGLVAAKAEASNMQYTSFSTCNVLKTVRGKSFIFIFIILLFRRFQIYFSASAGI